MKRWNRNDWQGRSEKQVEQAETVAFYAMLMLICATVIGAIFS